MRKWLILGVCTLTSILMADYKYDTTKGWSSTDGAVEKALAAGLENPDALRLMNQAAAEYAKGKHEEARTTYRDVLSRYPTSAWAAQALYEIAEIRLDQGDTAKAFDAYGQIVADYPAYPSFNKLVEEMFSLAERISDGKTASFLGWKYKDRQAAIDAFEKILTAAPYSDYAPKALHTIARLYKEKKETLSAIDAYERLIGNYPNHPMVVDAYWAMAEAYRSMVAGAPYDQGATVKAIGGYEELLGLYPDSPHAPEAKSRLVQMKDTLALGKYNLAVFYLNKRNNPTAAATLLKDVLQVAPESPTAIKAQKLLEKISNKDAVETKVEKKSTSKKLLDSLLFWKKQGE